MHWLIRSVALAFLGNVEKPRASLRQCLPGLEVLEARLVLAETYVWKGPKDGLWSIPAHWSKLDGTQATVLPTTDDTLRFTSNSHNNSVNNISKLTLRALEIYDNHAGTITLREPLKVKGGKFQEADKAIITGSSLEVVKGESTSAFTWKRGKVQGSATTTMSIIVRNGKLIIDGTPTLESAKLEVQPNWASPIKDDKDPQVQFINGTITLSGTGQIVNNGSFRVAGSNPRIYGSDRTKQSFTNGAGGVLWVRLSGPVSSPGFRMGANYKGLGSVDIQGVGFARMVLEEGGEIGDKVTLGTVTSPPGAPATSTLTSAIIFRGGVTSPLFTWKKGLTFSGNGLVKLEGRGVTGVNSDPYVQLEAGNNLFFSETMRFETVGGVLLGPGTISLGYAVRPFYLGGVQLGGAFPTTGTPVYHPFTLNINDSIAILYTVKGGGAKPYEPGLGKSSIIFVGGGRVQLGPEPSQVGPVLGTLGDLTQFEMGVGSQILLKSNKTNPSELRLVARVTLLGATIKAGEQKALIRAEDGTRIFKPANSGIARIQNSVAIEYPPPNAKARIEAGENRESALIPTEKTAHIEQYRRYLFTYYS